MDGGEVVEGADHLVGDAGKQHHGIQAGRSVFQALLGDHAPAEQGLAQDLDGFLALGGLIALEGFGRRGQLRAQFHPVDDEFNAGGLEARGHWGR